MSKSSTMVALVLAAGKGTRMKSDLPKVLHPVGGRPMVSHVLQSARAAGADRAIVVIGFEADSVRETLKDSVEYVVQTEQLGTGHAVIQARESLQDFDGTIMVLCGDTPLLTGATLINLAQEHLRMSAAATVLTANLSDPAGYGRVIRDAAGQVQKIVEQKDASSEELAVCEINTGIYCFSCKELFGALAAIGRDNAQGEYYLTDVLEELNRRGKIVRAVVAADFSETMGINSRVQLAEAEIILRDRKRTALMESGVTLLDPASIFVDADVEIGRDTVIYPFTWIEGDTHIGGNCRIGPNTRIQNSMIKDRVTLHFSYAHDCEIGAGASVGPYVHIRPDTVLGPETKVGNFVEIKNSTVGLGSKVPHLSYIGDTDMGAGVNIGSGTITVNYDGKAKHRTIIEDNVFVGCNTNLVAPVRVGEGAYIAAGSTITKDVPPKALGVARARQQNIERWTEKRGK